MAQLHLHIHKIRCQYGRIQFSELHRLSQIASVGEMYDLFAERSPRDERTI